MGLIPPVGEADGLVPLALQSARALVDSRPTAFLACAAVAANQLCELWFTAKRRPRVHSREGKAAKGCDLAEPPGRSATGMPFAEDQRHPPPLR